jgi:hypothetical protein
MMLGVRLIWLLTGLVSVAYITAGITFLCESMRSVHADSRRDILPDYFGIERCPRLLLSTLV